MALAQEDIDFIKANIGDWLLELSVGKPAAIYEAELRERMVRVEEELKHQRELMQRGFEQVDRRLEEQRVYMDKRFEQVDRHLEEQRVYMDKRFEQVDRQLEEQRFYMDKRFEQVDKRFDALTKRMDRFMIWSFGVTVSVAGVVIAVIKWT